MEMTNLDLLKSNLVGETIRFSQINHLEKKYGVNPLDPDENNPKVDEWISKNAKNYREYYDAYLYEQNPADLSNFLKIVSESNKDLGDILLDVPPYIDK